jgi:hypothetical protein
MGVLAEVIAAVLIFLIMLPPIVNLRRRGISRYSNFWKHYWITAILCIAVAFSEVLKNKPIVLVGMWTILAMFNLFVSSLLYKEFKK